MVGITNKFLNFFEPKWLMLTFTLSIVNESNMNEY